MHLVTLLLLTASLALAHYPIIEKRHDQNAIIDLRDPTAQSVAVYGRLSTPDEVDLYRFSAAKEQSIPVEALVPIRRGSERFRPCVAFLSKGGEELELPFDIPDGYGGVIIAAPEGQRETFFEPFSLERMYHGTERKFPVKPGAVYYIAVYDPSSYMGDYSLGIGTEENFEHASKGQLIANVLRTKFDLIADTAGPWIDIVGFCLFVVGIVLGFHGVGRSRIWQLTALLTAFSGALLMYRHSLISGVATFQALAGIILLVVVLTLRRARTVPLLCWSTILFLLAWYVWV
jgi:hypothetical protein